MIAVLGFILECAAIAAAVGAVVGVVVVAGLRVSAGWLARLHPALRADVHVVAGVLPALATVAALVATALPSVSSALGFGVDHCPGHGHHFHVCFMHFSGMRPVLAVVGAAALMTWVYRSAALVGTLVVTRRHARQLERLGAVEHQRYPVVLLPGVRLCHALGILRPRILLSADVRSALGPKELAAALAHEEAHLRRRDPLAALLLGVAGLFVVPPLAGWLRRQHRLASEEACDGAAAVAVGDGATVAGALVQVATLQHGGACRALTGPAFGEHDLEARVRRLLSADRFTAGTPRWPSLMAAAMVGLLLLVGPNVETFHHAAETFLGHLF